MIMTEPYWQDGDLTIYHGDCLNVMKTFPDNMIDLTITSPPYDDLRDYEGYNFNFKAIVQELYRVTKEGGVVVWVVGDQTKEFCESLSSFKQAIHFVDEVQFKLLDTMIYKKGGGPTQYPNLRRYSQWFEYMFVFIKGEKPKTFNPLKDIKTWAGKGHLNQSSTERQKTGETKLAGDYITSEYKMRCNIWEYHTGYNKSTSDRIAFKHPAIFPEALAKDHIKSWSNEGDLILDPMMGSGTTLKGCMQLHRKGIGIEIEEKYVKIAKQRLAERVLI